LLSFKPPGFFTSTKYEKLRIAEADAVVTSEEDGQEGRATTGARATRGTSHDDEDEEDSEEESESDLVDTDDNDRDGSDSAEEPAGAKNKNGKFQMNTRVGGFFGLLQDDEQDEDEEVGSEDEDVDGPR